MVLCLFVCLKLRCRCYLCFYIYTWNFFFSTENHIFVSSNYHLSDIFFDLLKFAAEYLVMGGRLVYWLPIYRPEYVFLISGM